MMRIYEVLPGKLLLSARTHTLDDSDCTMLVNRYKVTGVINLWHTPDLRIQAIVPWYDHIPMPDGRLHNEIIEKAKWAAERVVQEIEINGGCVLVHCWGGRNRSGLVIALALMRLQGITGAEAVRAVKAVRSGALVNKYFVHYLESKS